jgi:hypothetical protein
MENSFFILPEYIMKSHMEIKYAKVLPAILQILSNIRETSTSFDGPKIHPNG